MENNEKIFPTGEKAAIAQAIIKRAIELSDTTKHDIFLEWAPHVNQLNVGIHRGGWSRNRKCTYIDIDFASDTCDITGAVADLDAIFASLEEENQ